MSRIGRFLSLEPFRFPDFTTVCTRLLELLMLHLRELVRPSAELHDTGAVQATDATGLDRVAAGQHYAIQTNFKFNAVKTPGLFD
jgi:hypothetical protein